MPMITPDSQEPINIHSLDRYPPDELALAARAALLREAGLTVVVSNESRVLQRRSVGDMLGSIIGRKLTPADIDFAKGAVFSAVIVIRDSRSADAVSPESRDAVTNFLDRLTQIAITRRGLR